MTPSTGKRANSIPPAAHSAATLRALDASRRLIDLLKGCETAIYHVNVNVDKEALDIVARISQSVAVAREHAESLQNRVKQAAQERSGFWEPATDPFASTRRSLARRVQNTG